MGRRGWAWRQLQSRWGLLGQVMALPLGPGQVPRPEGAGQGGAGPRSRGQGGTAGEASGGPRSVSGIWRGRGRGGWERGEPGGVAKGGRRARPGRGDSPLGRPSCISESVSAQPSVWQVRAGGGGARSLACRRPRSPTADGAQAARHVSAPLVCGAAPAAPPPFAGARRGLLGTGKLGHAVAAAGLASEPAAVASVLQLASVHGRACACRTPRLWRAGLSFPSG